MKKLNIVFRPAALLVSGLLLPSLASAQNASDALLPGISNADLLLWILGTAIIVLFFLFMMVSVAAYSLISRMLDKEKEKARQGFKLKIDFWDKLNAAKPVAVEQDIMLAHDYDGIHELDNQLPPWWKGMFYLSIVFAVIYIYKYHIVWDEAVSVKEYKEEVLRAEVAKKEYLEKMANLIDETNVEATSDAAALSSGKQIFMANCKACHGGAGEGGVGPNLTDAYWLHGGDVKDIFKTIKYGVPAKGMLPWQDKLRPQQIQEVSSYILTLKGTNPPNAKEPQGEKAE